MSRSTATENPAAKDGHVVNGSSYRVKSFLLLPMLEKHRMWGVIVGINLQEEVLTATELSDVSISTSGTPPALSFAKLL